MKTELASRLPREAYAALFGRSTATAFQHPIWVDAFETHLAPGRDAETFHLLEWNDGELRATVSLTLRRKNGLRLLEAFDLGVCDYVAPVLTRGADAVRTGAAMRAVLPAHDLLRINNVRPEHAPFWNALSGEEAEPAGFSAHATTLAGTFDDWRARSLDRKLAGQTKRKWKRWQRDCDVQVLRTEGEEAARAVEELAAFRAGRFDGDPIQESHTQAFYAAVARVGSNGFAETWKLRSDGQTAGILFGITHVGTFHYLLIGCDYETFGRHSPGQQLYERVIEAWMKRGGESFDFTIGDEPFKAQYGTEAVAMARFSAARTWPGRLGRFVLERRRQLA